MDRQPFSATITLPPEIVDTVIDELHEQPKALKCCSLVSHIFVSRAQKHLFSTIRIIFPYKSTRHAAQPLLDVFVNNPDLARNVRNLIIKDYLEGAWDYEKKEFHRATDQVLPRLFEHLHCLTTFSLNGQMALTPSRMISDVQHLNDLSTQVVSALFQMFRSNKLAEISLEYITNFPVAHIALTCPHLQRLSIASIDSFDPLDDAVIYGAHLTTIDDKRESSSELPGSGVNSGHLEVLQFDNSSERAINKLYEYISSSQSLLTLSHLGKLILHGHNAAMRKVAAAVIADAASSLKLFLWDHNFHIEFADFEPSPIDLGVTTTLRTLRLACVHDPRSYPVHLFWVSQVLAAIRTHNDLEELIFVLSCDLTNMLDDDGYGAPEDWRSEFDSLLTSPGFERLHKVAIFIQFSDADIEDPLPTEDYVDVTVSFEAGLPLLRDAGLLSVQWVVNENLQGTAECAGIMDQDIDGEVVGIHILRRSQKLLFHWY